MATCHGTLDVAETPRAVVALVGHPNVGKSVLFQRLTGRYVTVSNYPGTTVELSRGMARDLPGVAVIDTPGIATLPARSEDELVTSRVLLCEPLRAVVQVGDAKSPRRTLSLALRLAELGLPMLLVCNMADEAKARGVDLDLPALAAALGVPVVATVAVSGQGVEQIPGLVERATPASIDIKYDSLVEEAVARIVPLLGGGPVAPRGLALLWLSGDAAAAGWVDQHLGEPERALLAEARALLAQAGDPTVLIEAARAAAATDLAARTARVGGSQRESLAGRLGRLATDPLWGLPVLAVVLYAVYWFVGVFGAGTLVGLLEEDLFGRLLNPWVEGVVRGLIPVPLIADFLVGEYGLWTMGVTYAAALLLPIVVTFFLAFGALEDSGYLPRLSVLSNRAFQAIGLNGKAVLPMILGLGCVTMATMTTRILERRRDRLLVILLLALAVPCSAQLGVVLGMLASISLGATLIWAGVLAGVLFVVGWLAARLVPGERSPLLVELPPLRLPRPGNVIIKTLARLEWYIREAVPLFLLGTALMFVLDALGVLPLIVIAGEPLVAGWLGLPPQASEAFLLGFLRRDFGATGLFAMQGAGALSPRQVVVAMVTLTLFIPCIASAIMIVKERGARTAAAIIALVFPLAFLVGGLLNMALVTMGWN